MPNNQHRPLLRAITATVIIALLIAVAFIVSSRAETGHPPERITTAAIGTPVVISDPPAWYESPAYVEAVNTARWYQWASQLPAPEPDRTSQHVRSGSRRSNAEIEACIIARENGGDYGRSSNPTHFGRYQFSRGTWAANGGDPDTWGHATPEEQDRVFRTTVDRNGYRDWTPYNGCG